MAMRAMLSSAALGLAAVAGCAGDPGARSGAEAGQAQGVWRVERMTGAPVYGAAGEVIGEVADIVVGPDDRVRAVVVAAGDLLDAGDVFLWVPWGQVDLTPGAPGVQVPGGEDNAAAFSRSGEEVERERRAWRASEVIGDEIRLAPGAGSGVVDDLVFDQRGALRSVVVTPDAGQGVSGSSAFPWPRFDAFDPGADVLDLPYTWQQTGEPPRFDDDLHDEVF